MRPMTGLLLTTWIACNASQAAAQTRHDPPASGGVINALPIDIANTTLLNAIFAGPPVLGRLGPAGPSVLEPSDAPFSYSGLSASQDTSVWRGADPRFGGVAADMSVRHWPSAFAVSTKRYDVDFSPHAGLGWLGGGASAEAGGMVRLGAHLQDKVIRGLNGLGVRETDPTAFRDRGRWFLFAAVSGQAVGLNMTRDSLGGPQRLGWSAEGTSALISDAQAGLGWRKGAMQASFGYVHREIKGDIASNVSGGPISYRDSMLAFSLSLRGR